MSSPPRLDIVIVSYNAASDLARCLESIAAAPPAVPFRVVVVDNASSDESVPIARASRLEPLVIAQPTNVGFARANNVGIRATDGALVLLLNSDTLVERGALDGLMDALLAEPSAAAAGPRLVDAAGRPELSVGGMIGPWAELKQKSLGALYARGVAPARWAVTRRTSRRHFPDWVSGAALLVWRAEAEAVGLLDERYFMYTEDVDFCAALRARGRRILFIPDVSITHLRGRSARSAPAATRVAYRRSQVAFYKKHHPKWAPILERYLRFKGEWPPDSSGFPVLS